MALRVAPTRAEAKDIAEAAGLDLEALSALTDEKGLAEVGEVEVVVELGGRPDGMGFEPPLA